MTLEAGMNKLLIATIGLRHLWLHLEASTCPPPPSTGRDDHEAMAVVTLSSFFQQRPGLTGHRTRMIALPPVPQNSKRSQEAARQKCLIASGPLP